ncbi:UNVERIFIED_CONTAM: hypothetical protein HHA_453300 [Hammondia hammondi]|eukprot:XP_008886583.1 hypothetical protein HHA_453300 [Hammondia hammondi]
MSPRSSRPGHKCRSCVTPKFENRTRSVGTETSVSQRDLPFSDTPVFYRLQGETSTKDGPLSVQCRCAGQPKIFAAQAAFLIDFSLLSLGLLCW